MPRLASAALLILSITSPLLSSCETNSRPSSNKLSARETTAWGSREEVETWQRGRTDYLITTPAN
jgi:hypothetical protein